MARARSFIKRHPIGLSSFAFVIVLGGGLLWREVKPMFFADDVHVAYVVPKAPQLTARAGETVFRIDPTLSSAGYSVDEKLVGSAHGTATGTTQGIAGDIALNTGNPSESRIGDIVINVEQLHSDNALRDARIRTDFLESHEHKLVTFHPTRITGLPERVDADDSYQFKIVGTLDVKDKTIPATFDVTARRIGDELTATATSTIKMSDAGVGPINVIGLLSTGDDMKLTLKLTAADPTKQDIPTAIPSPKVAAAAKGGPSFSKKIQPVLEQSCASCHSTGQAGSNEWKLGTAEDAVTSAQGIAMVVQAGYMPPWPASGASVPLQHVRTLDPATRQTIIDWAKAGAPLDVDGSTRIKPSKSQDPIPRRDVVLKSPEPYVGKPSNQNDYRCFLVDPHFTQPTYITGYNFEPQHPAVVHHALVYRVGANADAEAAKKEAEDPEPGWQCYTGTGLPSQGVGGGGLVAGWAPGQNPTKFGADSGFLMQPGDKLVMQIHYHYDHEFPPDQSKLALETAPGTAHLRELVVRNPTAPVEIPCETGETGPLCDRTAAMADVAARFGPAATSIPNGLLRLCQKTPDMFAGQTNGIGSTSCDSRVGVAGDLVGVLGHMHELGRSFKMTLNPDTPQQKVLLDIPLWNFDWQLNYSLVTPIPVTPQDRIRIECSWDRSLGAGRVPRYLLFAEGTEDEMCFSTFTVLTDKRD